LREINMREIPKNRRKSTRGNSLVEFALVAPVFVLMLLGTAQLGFYAYAFVSVENASRSAVLRNSSGSESAIDQETACAVVVEEMRGMPNLGASFSSPCTSAPLVVNSRLCSDAQPCSGGAISADGAPAAAVTVAYTMPTFLPMGGPAVISRTVHMKLRSLE
jgi:Flp pilus assembly protein TadG